MTTENEKQAGSDLTASTGSRLTSDEMVELVKRIEEKITPICDNKALRSRILRAVAEYSERQNLFFKNEKENEENSTKPTRAAR